MWIVAHFLSRVSQNVTLALLERSSYLCMVEAPDLKMKELRAHRQSLHVYCPDGINVVYMLIHRYLGLIHLASGYDVHTISFVSTSKHSSKKQGAYTSLCCRQENISKM